MRGRGRRIDIGYIGSSFVDQLHHGTLCLVACFQVTQAIK
ncbi:hypothetical protein PCLA_07f0322 [Pseudomonas citronellolis]|nr:hypothetical protein PCLA_07f0322 [Pseudomonas citronellolis]